MRHVLVSYLLITTFCLGLGFLIKGGLYLTHNIHRAYSGVSPLSIVRLTKSGETFCTGTVLTSHTILTAFHCAVYFPDESVEIRLFDGSYTGATAHYRFGVEKTDIALLEGDFRNLVPAKYEADPNKLVQIQQYGKQMSLCGYPYGSKLFCSEGRFVGPNGFGELVTAIAIPGMSGGPALDDSGVVIGVVSGVDADHAIFIPLYNLEDRIL